MLRLDLGVPSLANMVRLWRAHARERREDARARQEELRTAQERAKQLLDKWLSPAQRHQLKESGYFEVLGNDTGTKYRIYRDHTACQEQTKKQTNYCFVPSSDIDSYLPQADRMLAQKIALENFEKAALKVAYSS
jgi:hypothetical protein